METAKLSKTGQITIPPILRDYFQWEDGQELMIINFGDGILLRPKKNFPETTLEDVAGCLPYQGEPKTMADMEQAISFGVEEQWKQ